MKDPDPSIPILIVDDNPENLLVMEAVLRRPDFNITQVSSGKEALALTELHEYAAILMDVMMPEMDGYETARLIRKKSFSQYFPIIFVTEGMDEADRIHLGYEFGAVDYIFKPFEPIIMKSKLSIFADLYRVRKKNEHQAELLRLRDQIEHNNALENALDAFVEMNQVGIVIYWNLQAENIFGHSKAYAIGKKLSDLIIPDSYKISHEKGLAHFLKTGDGPILNRRIEIEAKKENGTIFPVEVAVTPLKIGGQYVFSAFIRDISNKKAEEESLRRAIEARDEFISVCSHELKTPLTSMKMQFQIAQKLSHEGNPKAFDRANVQRRIDLSNKQLNRMSRLIDNMLYVSNISSGQLGLEKEVINLNSLVDEVLDTFQEQIEMAKIDVKFHAKTTRPAAILGDSYRMEQVISNLLTNAIKYGDGKPIQIILDETQGKIILSVVDHGMGIDTQSVDKIFERYERAIDASKISGLGLGLYISQTIVHAHQGKIFVQSVLGKGSTFSIELPSYKKEPDL